MKNLSQVSLYAIMVVVAMAMVAFPELAFAQNPIIDGMKNNTALAAARALIMVVALLVLAGQVLPSLLKGEGAEVVKGSLGVAILIGIAYKLKDLIDLFQ